MQIFIRDETRQGKTIALDVEKTDTLNKLQKYIFEKTLIPRANQRLSFNGKFLTSNKTLSEMNVEKESTIHLSFRFFKEYSLSHEELAFLIKLNLEREKYI